MKKITMFIRQNFCDDGETLYEGLTKVGAFYKKHKLMQTSLTVSHMLQELENVQSVLGTHNVSQRKLRHALVRLRYFRHLCSEARILIEGQIVRKTPLSSKYMYRGQNF